MNETRKIQSYLWMIAIILSLILLAVSYTYLKEYDHKVERSFITPYEIGSSQFINSKGQQDEIFYALQNPTKTDFIFILWIKSSLPLMVDILHNSQVDQNITITSKGIRFNFNEGGTYKVYKSLNLSLSAFISQFNLTDPIDQDSYLPLYFNLYDNQPPYLNFVIDSTHVYDPSSFKEPTNDSLIYLTIVILLGFYHYEQTDRFMKFKKRFMDRKIVQKLNPDQFYPDPYLSHPDLEKEIPDIYRETIYIAFVFILLALTHFIASNLRVFYNLIIIFFVLHLVLLIQFIKLMYYSNAQAVSLPFLTSIYPSVFLLRYRYNSNIEPYELSPHQFLISFFIIWFIVCYGIFILSLYRFDEKEEFTIKEYILFNRKYSVPQFFRLLSLMLLLALGMWFLLIGL